MDCCPELGNNSTLSQLFVRLMSVPFLSKRCHDRTLILLPILIAMRKFLLHVLRCLKLHRRNNLLLSFLIDNNIFEFSIFSFGDIYTTGFLNRTLLCSLCNSWTTPVSPARQLLLNCFPCFQLGKDCLFFRKVLMLQYRQTFPISS
jgi:hypothetical protein